MHKLANFSSYNHVLLFFTGAVVLVLEIGGTRLLAPFYGSTIFVWSSLITVTLGSLAMGYFFGGKLADRYPSQRVYYYVITGAAISAILLLKLNRFFLVISDNLGFRLGPLLASVLIFCLPLFFYSMIGPLLIRINEADVSRSGNNAGLVFGVSTFGSLSGALLAGFYLIPNFSLKAVLIYSNMAVLILAIIALWFLKIKKRYLLTIIVFSIIVFYLPVIDYGTSNKLSITHSEPSFYADLKVANLPYADLFLMDGVTQSVFPRNTEQSFANEALQVERQLDKSETINSILVLGFGAGTAATVIDPKYAVDYVELDSKMLDIAREYFDYQEDDNDQVIISDAREYLRRTDKKYDVIYADIYHSSVIPSHTFTKEALELMEEHLNEGGILFSNILGETDSELIESLALTLRSVFKNTYFSATQDGFTNILAYATNNDDFAPDFGARHKEVFIEEGGVVISDDKNPLDLMSSLRLDKYLDLSKEVFGYDPMFVI